jgi:MYXO-CTERM domain-containing protein
MPKYDLPCTVDADCGEHFTCTPDVSTECWASGSSGGGASAGDAGTGEPAADASPPASGCTTTTLATSSCVLQTIVCTTAADCPSTWTCQSAPSSTVEYNCGALVAGFDAGGCNVPPTDGQSTCVPPNYTTGVGTSTGSTFTTGTGSAGGTASDAGTAAPVSAAAGTSGAAGGGDHGCQMGGSPGSGASGAWLALLGALGFVARRRRRVSIETR